MPTTSKSKIRIVYIVELTRQGKLECSAHHTKLMKREAFSESPIRFEQLFSTKLVNALSPADRKLALQLRANCSPQEPDVAKLSGLEGYDIFRDLIDTGRAFWARGSHSRLNWDEVPMPVKLDWHHSPGSYRPILSPAQPEAVILPLCPPLHVIPCKNICGPVAGKASDSLLGEWATCRSMETDAARTFCLRLLNRYAGESFPIPESIKVKEIASAQIVPELTLSHRATSTRTGLATSLNEIVLVKMHFRYGKRRVELDSDLDWVSYTDHETVIRMPRDRKLEDDCEQRLLQLGFEPAPSNNNGELLCLDAGGYLLAAHAPTNWEELLDQVFPKLETAGWKITHAPGFRLNSASAAELFSEVSTHQSWFEYSVGVSFKGMRFSVIDLIREFIRSSSNDNLADMLKELGRRNLALPLEDGELLVLPGKLLQNILREIFELLGQRAESGPLKLSRWSVAELANKGLLDASSINTQHLPDMDVLRRYMTGNFELQALEPPASLRAELRDYQKDGIAWLQFLRESGTHGILADDMGLGKTLQAIACLTIEQEAGRLHAPSLVVAPTSVIDNWKAEIERFAPDLDCQIYHGSERNQTLKNAGSQTILITTYAVIRNDVEQLTDRQWYYLIVDEAQFIKNPQSLAARCLCQLSAKHKLCLSGTPIENKLTELWSLFHFLMPDFLGSQRIFHQTYAREIESGSAEGRTLAGHLRKRISPFLLRRKKELVATELPPKTEIIRPVELSQQQADYYEAVRAAMNQKVTHELENKGFAASRIVVLDALLKLRQICCDPRLYLKHTETSEIPSAKLETALELIESLLRNGHRILLFSQFTSMLVLIETELRARSINFRTLTGATKNRGTLVQSFQAGDFPLFLISLKAGGTGLNLTAADTIIHYDPWWNPAAEAQATDRSHRIGQAKPVFIYKLIAENTVEAKILELQKQKQQLASELLDETPGENLSAFTEQDILELFKTE